MFQPMSQATIRNARTVLLAGLLATASGCAVWSPPAPPQSSIADTDETFSRPMRAAPPEEKLPWYDMRNILDPRSREIERRLGGG